MDRCILKLMVDDPAIVKFLDSSIQYYNHLYEQHTHQALFFEPIQGGFLLIYKDVDTFKSMAATRINLQHDPNHRIKYELDLFPKKMFPPGGFSGSISVQGMDFTTIYPALKNYFESLDAGFTIKKTENSEAIIHCTTYKGFVKLIETYFGSFVTPN